MLFLASTPHAVLVKQRHQILHNPSVVDLPGLSERKPNSPVQDQVWSFTRTSLFKLLGFCWGFGLSDLGLKMWA